MKPHAPTLHEVALPLTDRWQTLVAIDFDKWAAATYAANFPGVDVRCASVADELDRLPYVDVICGGPPCQPFRDAGENEGEADDRDCIPDFCAAIERGQPRQFLMENVRGLLKAKHRDYLHRVLARMKAAGYVVQWKLLDAVSYGVPQFRKRVWFWGIRADLFAAGVRHDWPMPTHAWPPPAGADLFGPALLAGVTVRQALGLTLPMRLEAHGGNTGGDLSPDSPSPTMRGALAGCSDILISSHADPARAIDEPACSLRSGGAGHDGCCVRLWTWSDEYLEKRPPASPAPTVTAQWAKGLPNGCIDVSEFVLTDEQLARMEAMDLSQGRLTMREVEPTKPSPTIGAKNCQLTNDCLKLRTPLYVRRLTPIECARLQSMPDDFAWPEKVTKTAMYRVIGNGWASEMARVMSLALASADPDSRTVADLFCGGGLGAVGWHGRSWRYEPAAAGKAVPVVA